MTSAIAVSSSTHSAEGDTSDQAYTSRQKTKL